MKNEKNKGGFDPNQYEGPGPMKKNRSAIKKMKTVSVSNLMVDAESIAWFLFGFYRM